ncbi:unnamed protein product, partial [Didymodactylos carnosus]
VQKCCLMRMKKLNNDTSEFEYEEIDGTVENEQHQCASEHNNALNSTDMHGKQFSNPSEQIYDNTHKNLPLVNENIPVLVNRKQFKLTSSNTSLSSSSALRVISLNNETTNLQQQTTAEITVADDDFVDEMNVQNSNNNSTQLSITAPTQINTPPLLNSSLPMQNNSQSRLQISRTQPQSLSCPSIIKNTKQFSMQGRPQLLPDSRHQRKGKITASIDLNKEFDIFRKMN